jgi:hypothetical protein
MTKDTSRFDPGPGPVSPFQGSILVALHPRLKPWAISWRRPLRGAFRLRDLRDLASHSRWPLLGALLIVVFVASLDLVPRASSLLPTAAASPPAAAAPPPAVSDPHSPTSPLPDLAVQVADTALWAPVLSSVGLQASDGASRFRILVGNSAAAREAGFQPSAKTVRVASVTDVHDPTLGIFWEQPQELPVYALPAQATVFASEKRTGAPLLAGFRTATGGVLWAITAPGPSGYDRFPYVSHALVNLGLVLPFREARTWAFFDYSYRTRVDPDYMARRWRSAGIAALHVSGWHFFEPHPDRDRYLAELIAACHREGVLVYVWLELPHVSERFWESNPGCREKTATLQDAQLDWRKLVNLAAPECFDKAAAGVRQLLHRFSWDGVNLAELYFESLHGPSNPPRFTPLNDWVRQEAAAAIGFDPIELFDPESAHFWSRDHKAWKQFVDYRAGLALSLQQRWLELIRAELPEADVAVTQIDDRFDDRMRELLGADTAALLPLAERYDFSLVIEDPATLWSLGPQRYPEIARRYQPLARDPQRLAIDINIVERYQRTYPTKKQVGTELFQLLRLAGQSFPRTLLYFEHSISHPDWDLLPYAAANAHATAKDANQVTVTAAKPSGLSWKGPAAVNGRPWPAADDATVWLPAGRHTVAPADSPPVARLLYLNGDLLSATVTQDAIEFEYRSRAQAIALLNAKPGRILLDGAAAPVAVLKATRHFSLLLPKGTHRVRVTVMSLLP